MSDPSTTAAVDAPRPEHIPLGLYRHYRGGGVYDVIDLAFDSTNGAGEGRWMVLYRSHTSGRLNVREVGQFTELVAWPDGATRPRFVPSSRETLPAPGVPHAVPEAEMNRRGEEIIRRARAELLALDPYCDCVVLWATRKLLGLSLDERVTLRADADALFDLVEFLERAQGIRRLRYGLDPTVVDGPADPRAVKDGALVRRVTVQVGEQEMPVAWALELLRRVEEGTDVH